MESGKLVGKAGRSDIQLVTESDWLQAPSSSTENTI